MTANILLPRNRTYLVALSAPSYVAANIKGLTVDSLLGATEENIFLDNTKPLTNIYYSSAGWNGVSRCDPTPPAKVFISGVPLPTNFIVGSPTEYYTDGICMQAIETLHGDCVIDLSVEIAFH